MRTAKIRHDLRLQKCGQILQIQLTPDNLNPHQLEPRTNSNQNRFPLDFRNTFTSNFTLAETSKVRVTEAR